jgi:gamma-glutamyl hercynylcysteine S-oxide synthase
MERIICVTQRFINLSVFIAIVATASWAQDTRYAPSTFHDQLLTSPPCLTIRDAWEGGSAPCSPFAHEEWLTDLTHWRAERRIRIGYDPARYAMPALEWTQSSFIQPQMMVQDRYFYDPEQGHYTVDRYLDDLDKRYGGIDSVLIWATYPNMGIDDRNQQDMVRSMPGGVEGVKKMVADFHRRGVRVLFPMMMWDQGTREPEKPWPDATAEFMKQIGADGINGDTQDGVPLAFTLAAEKVDHPLAFEPEVGLSDEALAWDVMSWGYYSHFNFIPQVDRFRWLEPKHMVNVCDRWNRSKTDNLQFAFFNGEGWESWENVWGIWNGITPRDSEATRRMATIERAFAPFLTSKDWEPFYAMHMYGVYASRWPLGDQTLWTIINRNEYDVDGRQMTVPYKDHAVLSFNTEAHGFGAILATMGEPDAKTAQLLKKMSEMTAKPLSSFSSVWEKTNQTLVEIPRTTPAQTTPEGMVRVNGGNFLFIVQGTEIEGNNDIGVDVQYPWEDSPRRYHEHLMEIKPFYIDKYPVTNAAFKKFLDASHYHPKDDLNFLKNWSGGTFPEGAANQPVTWISLEDARAYAKWAGKRLPHEWEWQFAAQGTDGRIFPWGNCDWNVPSVLGGPITCTESADPRDAVAPTLDKGRVMLAASNVDAHPKGASPFGVMDLVGNVWQWTDEYVDDHTRAAILRGGSHYQPQGSLWYFPQAHKNNEHSKLLLMAPSYDRSGAVGFRCVKDAE